MYSGEFKSNRFWCVSVALYHGIQNHVFCPHLEMVPNMLFWHETSSKVEKSWKMDFWKFFKIFPLSPRHFGVFLVKKSKIWNFAGNGPKHVVLTWNEFWSWKKLKNRVLKFSSYSPRLSTSLWRFFCVVEKLNKFLKVLTTKIWNRKSHVLRQGIGRYWEGEKEFSCFNIGNILSYIFSHVLRKEIPTTM